MTDTLQARYEDLAAIAGRFGKQSEATQQSLTRLQRQLARVQATWQGVGSAAFFDEMQRDVLPATQRLIAALRQAQQVTLQIAQVLGNAENEAAALFIHDGYIDFTVPTDGRIEPVPFGDPTAGSTPLPPKYGTREWAQAGLLEAAGIDPATYDPERDYAFNRQAIEQGYAYYQKLYQENPEFWWMGFAYSAVQRSIYPAFLMLDSMEQFLYIYERMAFMRPRLPGWYVEGVADILAAHLFGPNAPRELVAVTEAMLAGRITANDIAAIRQDFVRMQHDIFMDMGAAHYAYEQGGIELVREMVANGQMNERLLPAFEIIHEAQMTGDTSRLGEAAAIMAQREQMDLLQKYYQHIGSMGESGHLMLDAMSAMAVPAVPNGQMMWGVVPGGRIDNGDQRMAWINSEIAAWGELSPAERAAAVNLPLPQTPEEAIWALERAWRPLAIDRGLDAIPIPGPLSPADWISFWQQLEAAR